MKEELDTAVALEEVSLEFPVMKSKSLLVKDFVFGRWKSILNKKTYLALSDLSFEIKRGEVIGIVGPNGAGKSTLLRLIAGIYVPENGSVKTYGKISLLAGLGAGFQSNLTGRENIMLSSSIYGFTKEQILEMTPSIIDYSGIESFIDQPIRTYSSGMRARLAFSIVSHIEPDIILIDEVIAVGDASFKKKSMARIKELASSDSTVIIVSHSQSLLKMICSKIICLDNGKLDCFTEDKDHAISRYHELSKKNKK